MQSHDPKAFLRSFFADHRVALIVYVVAGVEATRRQLLMTSSAPGALSA